MFGPVQVNRVLKALEEKWVLQDLKAGSIIMIFYLFLNLYLSECNDEFCTGDRGVQGSPGSKGSSFLLFFLTVLIFKGV